MQEYFSKLLLVILASGLAGVLPATAEPIKIGVPTALTGDAAAFGQDIKNALTLANETLGGGKYELIFEDERCTNKDAASVAHKLIDLDKVKYALGFPCNGTLQATAPIYNRAGVLVITSSATSGDVLDMGENIFRLFPSDVGCAEKLHTYVAQRNKKVAVITEQNEFPVMMDRSFTSFNEKNSPQVKVQTFDFIHGITDLRTVAAKLRLEGFDGVFVNANTDESFVSMVKQLKNQELKVDYYGAYTPGSAVARETLGSLVDGFKFCNLPLSNELVSEKGKDLFQKFVARFGEPQSGFPVVPVALESFRLLDLALSSGEDPKKFLHSRKFSDGFIPTYWLDEHEAVQGIDFQMQTVKAGKVEKLG